MTSYERDDLIHIMKMNRLALQESDSAHLRFSGQLNQSNFEVNIITVGGLPTLTIKREDTISFQDTLRSVDDLKIFFDERLYQFLNAEAA
jgi:hypothetical protein